MSALSNGLVFLAERPRLRWAAFALCLLGATLLAYAPALNAGFIWDDNDYVTENPLLWEPDGLWRIWFTMDAPSQYVPMVYSLLRFEYALFALDPLGYHLVNVVLHAVNALLLAWLLTRLELPGAWFAAAIFAIHPVHVESVAWVTELKNVLSMFFFLLAALAWLRFLEPGKPASGRFYLLSLGLYLLALLAKATACTFPAAQLLLLWWRGERIDLRRIMQIAGFVFVGIVVGLIVVFWEVVKQGTDDERFTLSLGGSFIVASRAVWFYLGKLIWPHPLIFSYPKFYVDDADPFQYMWLVAGLLVLGVLWIMRDRFTRGPLVAMLFFIAMLSPLLGFIPLFTFWYTYVADHYQYVASIGPIALFAAVTVPWARRNLHPLFASALGLVLLAGLSLLTFQQTRIYENRETLWRHTISENPASWMAHTNLGRYLMGEKRYEEARQAYAGALEWQPSAYRAINGMARAEVALGNPESARSLLDRSVEIAPDSYVTRRLRGRVLWKLGERELALVEFHKLPVIRPHDAEAHFLVGSMLLLSGRQEDAHKALRQVLAIDPNHVGAKRMLRRGLAR